ncbi:mitochondrial carrier [Artomyces pyxidatus]|uniref:Mitochondrial carrier n=1 Tax=Artomyces pyxidatus TaxID=48021 RepID=A0ACB8SVT2_9AGAM|nr:mitochondrial carrier [Artomyces pyxidatus]
MTSTLPPLVQAFSGALGSAAANAVAYPLDLVTTRLQTTKHRGLTARNVIQNTVQKHGVAALYDGLPSDSAYTLLTNFLYFYTYTRLRGTVIHRVRSLSVSQELAIGFAAGVVSKLISTPLSIVTVRLQTARDDEDEEEGEKEEPSVLAVVRAIYREHGLAGFWRGFQTTFLLCLNPSLTFALLQLYRRLFVRARVVSPGHAFFGAAIANSLANTILYPLILAKTRMQLPSPSDPQSKPSLVGALKSSVRTASSEKAASERPPLTRIPTSARPYPGGPYQALSAQIVKGFLSQGITFLVKQRVETGVVLWARRAQ